MMNNTIFGNSVQVESLIENVFKPICIFENNGEQYYAFSTEEIEEGKMMLKYDLNPLSDNAKQMLLTSLYYRFQDGTLTNELQIQDPLPEPAQNHFRILVQIDKYEKYVEEYFIYNAVPEENFATLVYPLNFQMGINKVELIAINLTEEKYNLLCKQGKTEKVAKVVNQRITKVSNTLTATTKITMNEVVNPLAVATTKVGATIASGMAKTAMDCAFTAVAEVMKDASSFSLKELKQREDVCVMKYCARKMLNKGAEEKQASNNFSF